METNAKNNKALILTLLVTAAAVLAYKFMPEFHLADSFVELVLEQLEMLALAVIAALITKRLGSLQPGSKGMKTGIRAGDYLLLLGAAKVVEWIVYLVIGKSDVSVPAADILLFVVWVLLIGISEELLFRGVLLNGLLEYFGTDSEKGIRKAVVIGGILFGAVHLLNLTNGDDVLYGTVKALCNMADGVLFCVIYVYAGRNIWPCILIHAFYDAGNYLSSGILCATTSASVEAGKTAVSMSLILRIVFLAACSAFIAYYLMKGKKLQDYLNGSVQTAQPEKTSK